MAIFDLVLLLAGCCVVLFSFASEGGLHFEVGTVPLRVRSYANGKSPGAGEVVASPVPWLDGLLVADVDGSISHWSRKRGKLELRKQASSGSLGGGVAAMAAAGGERVTTLSHVGEVAMYDADLRLLWRMRVTESEHLSEAAVCFWSEGVRRGDNAGTVLAMVREGMTASRAGSEKSRDKARRVGVHDAAGRLRVLALDGKTGAVRWDSMEAEHFTSASLAAKAGMDIDTFRRHIVAEMDPGEAPWSDFAEDFERELPFEWRSPEDSAVRTRAWRSSNSSNVIVARHAHGLSVFHAYSGRLLSRLPLESGLHADADSDGVVETFGVALPVRLDENGSPVPGPPGKCEGWVRVGLPSMHATAPVPLCAHLSDNQRVGLSGSGPVVLLSGSKGNASHLAYLLSTGELVLADARYNLRGGSVAARVATVAGWDTHPTVGYRFVGLSLFGPRHLLLLVGDKHVVVASGARGAARVLGSAALEEPAVRQPLVAHLNRDRHWDVVVTSASRVTVFSVVPERASRLTGFVVLALLALLGAAAFVLTRGSTTSSKTN